MLPPLLVTLPQMVRPARQLPCAHPASEHLVATASDLSIIAYRGCAIALGGRWDAKTSSALRCPHTFPRAATPDGTRALPHSPPMSRVIPR